MFNGDTHAGNGHLTYSVMFNACSTWEVVSSETEGADECDPHEGPGWAWADW